jgi:hypothetical protein
MLVATKVFDAMGMSLFHFMINAWFGILAIIGYESKVLARNISHQWGEILLLKMIYDLR